MSVTILSRWKGNPKDAARVGKKTKPIFKKHGAEMMRMATFYSGPYTGQILVAIRYPDWKTYGNAMQALSTDAQYQKIIEEVRKVAELQSRSIVVGLDL
ncbi:MAG: hypothetical protein HYR63_21470 [Proteobacteria bacterium]|nr:hypothetical protein [Pseudomonadota bacterium]MBI3500125.1 hypothetical protein [Pseudomonadota bacterium]